MFHERLAGASSNSVLATVLSELWDAQALPLWQRWMEPREARRCTLSVSMSTSASLNVWPRAMPRGRDTMQYHINQVARRFARG